MTFRGINLILLALLFSGCASMEEPLWILLGDTQEKGFFSTGIKSEGKPTTTISTKSNPPTNQGSKPRLMDKNHDTSKILFLEMNCHNRR